MITLRDYQRDAADSAEPLLHRKVSSLVVMPTGTGKCLGKGTPVLMFDGTVRNVEDLVVGDMIMGPDSTPRTILSLSRGSEMMYRIVPTKGDSYVVNESHILSLKLTPEHQGEKHRVINISVRDYLVQSNTFKHRAKGYRVGVNFPGKEVPIDPYFLGLWLADGNAHDLRISKPDREVLESLQAYADELGLDLHSRYRVGKCVSHGITSKNRGAKKGSNELLTMFKQLNLLNNKHVPQDYLANSESVRLSLLAGLLDGDGSVSGSGFEFSNTNKKIVDAVCFLARSLGLAAYAKQRTTHDQNGVSCLSYRVNISGNCSKIPCRIERRIPADRRMNKDVLVHGISVEPVGVGEYFGFEIDGDKLFLLGDFTVTHNTTVIGDVVGRFLPHGKIMVIAHTEELIDQLAERIRIMNPEVNVGIEMGERTCTDESQWLFGRSRVFVGSRQSMCRPARLNHFKPEEFSLLIIDEAHHGIASSYRKIIDHFNQSALLGVTATPDRGDEARLSEVFAEVAYQMTITDAIDNGWLLPVKQQFVEVEGLDFSAAKGKDGEYSDQKLDRILAAEPRVAHEIAAAAVASCPGQTLVFTPGVEMSRLVSDIINRYPGQTAEVVVGETHKQRRREIIAEYRRGNLKFLVGCAVFLEGFDAPETRHLLNARPFRQRSTYSQFVGRVMRPLAGIVDGPVDAEGRKAAIAASAKPFGHVIDLTSASSEHELVFTGDILGGKDYTPGARKAALKRAKKAGGPVDLVKLMEEEEKRIRQQVEERERRKLARAEAKISVHDVQPGQGGHSSGKSAMPSPKMREFLAEHGYDADGMSYDQAARLIGKLRKTWLTGEASPKQQDLLRKYGLPTEVSKITASVLIDLIAGRGWRGLDYTPSRELWRIVPAKEGGFRAVVNDPDKGPLTLRKDKPSFRTVEECRAYFAPVFDQLPSLA